MSRRRYLVLDNLDSRVGGDMLNLICSAATGVAWKKRELYKDGQEVSFTPHCFLAITSREPRFTRDDLVSRLLLFSTQKIDHPISRSDLMDPMLTARSAILTEVLVNLNSVIALLWLAEAQRKENPIQCISRLADWETLGRAICGQGSALYQFCYALDLMNEKKDALAIENEGVYQVLYYLVYEQGWQLDGLSPNDLYVKLVDMADQMKLKDFQKYCKSPVSMGKWLKHNEQELERRFEVKVFDYPNGQREYTIKALGGSPGPIVLSEARMLELSKCSKMEDLHQLLDEAVGAGELYNWRRQEDGDYWLDLDAGPHRREPGYEG